MVEEGAQSDPEILALQKLSENGAAQLGLAGDSVGVDFTMSYRRSSQKSWRRPVPASLCMNGCIKHA